MKQNEFYTNYLRISVTDRCNLRCKYCIPEEGVKLISHSEVLRYEEIERIINILKNIGVNKIRITGGEPLIRKGITDFLKKIDYNNIHLTTNLTADDNIISELNQIKLNSINISLDTLNEKKYYELTNQNLFNKVIYNLKNLKIANKKMNTVILKGYNDDEIFNIVNFALENNITIRFIEKMNWVSDGFKSISNEEIKKKLISNGIISKESFNIDNSVAIYHKINNFSCSNANTNTISNPNLNVNSNTNLNDNTNANANSNANLNANSNDNTNANHNPFLSSVPYVGFISPLSNRFCLRCNRLRLTSDGKLKLCLYDEYLHDIRYYIRNNYEDNYILDVIKEIIKTKPTECKKMQGKNMSFYGG